MTNTLSPVLLSRLDRLSGCQGQWIVDCRDDDNRGHDCHRLGESFFAGGSYHKPTTPEEAAAVAADCLWRGIRLLFSPDKLDADCSWPGGYEAPSIYRSNNRVFKERFSAELEVADGDHDGLSLDVRFVTDEMIEAICGLEDYPLLDEDDHSGFELELQDEAWEQWAASDWRRIVCGKLDEALPDDCETDGDEILDRIANVDNKLQELFHACAETSSTYWQEESGEQWIDLKRVAGALDLADLRDLTGLPLLSADQEWRREPYPWPGAEASPLVPALAL